MKGILATEQGSKMAPWIAFLRIFLGAFWLYEVTMGNNWKTGSFTSGPNPDWFGPGAGSAILHEGQAGMDAGGWAWFGWVLENIMYPNAALWGYFAVAVQFILAFAFIFGVMSRPAAVLGLGMDFFIYNLGNSRIPPFFTLGHLFILATSAGMYYGVDAWLVEKLKNAKSGGARLLKSIITFDFVTPAMLRFLASAAAVFAVYYLLAIANLPSSKMRMVGMDVAVILGLVSYGLFVYKDKMNPVILSTSLIRIWLGYRLLHEIVVRYVPALNGLPGKWGQSAELGKVFASIGEKHWDVFGGIVNTVFTPAAGFWSIVFALVQTTVAIMLLLGIRTRLASKIGLIFLSLLIVIGFTRYSPFVFGYMFLVLTLDGGRMFSFDAVNNVESKIGINLSKTVTYILIGISLVAVIVANIDGIKPNGYQSSMGPVMAAMVAMLTALIGLTGLFQNGILFSDKITKQ